jgi:N-acetylglucosaminyl-diphospho-decaprenol L-rhamnosyltransferase
VPAGEGGGVMPELSFIIVNWNGGELLRRCVESVAAHPPSVAYEVVVVDNDSHDDSLARLEASPAAAALAGEGRLRVVRNPDNVGFGRANNLAFGLASAPLLFLLNPDTEVTPGSLDRLLATLQSDPRNGAVGPRLLNEDGSLQVSVWRNPPAAWEILLSQTHLYRLLPRGLRGELLLGGHWDHGRRRGVRMLSGAAVLVRREVVEEVGGFDERFHMYGEDNEWCLRMARAGWRLVFEPEAVVKHLGAASSLKRWNQLEKLRVQLDASYSFQRHCLSRPRLVANLLASYSVASLQERWRKVRGRPTDEVGLARRAHLDHLKAALGVGRRPPAGAR